ncbi:adenylate/guanylate cyclase domain-containing protein [Brucellaceae bacterium VT-16-1752]|uniref:Adenylate/guanylate cyclase domain-containing protein n=1 Tax=Ochrobactrum soli TaxID=2448455 RepID=A0A849KEK0_9HYPH|nr:MULTISPECIES: adenylate/guanylate cyclase domain-containing protein [Brucella]MCI1000418.1 adenylate/guanylate cyclase domain-containing protein [Ochrobactrum sp. C6C9]RRD26327.1 adenylate/guanylate cyclase domain-containing protein [Brucellaceae bacterium VT-16-1752]WHT45032.1 adenylate/guanylate cyclase domain-containing protein [Ochrobactrum sp. SSR]NNU60015.1 adenylate/guanylate cyclase domain-containing protein [[Ochrobactrum] soli]WHS29492.1 adenylate/guanylate cyclase domain-containi
MDVPRIPISETLLSPVLHWLQQSALNGASLETLAEGFCERLAAAGVPLMRVHLSFSMLHPLYDALGFTWIRGKGMEIEGFRASTSEKDAERFLTSPYFHLLSNNLQYLRRQIDPSAPSEFPVFDELKEIGATDYLAFVQSFGDGNSQGMVGSWTTDIPGGFGDDVVETLLNIQNSLAIAAKMAVLGKLADNMVTTYLGGNAGKRVLSGQIRRGDGETIRAVLVMGDMRQSTDLAEKAGRQVYIDTLNEFFDAIAAPFNKNGGEITSFVGDGFLAVYPCGRHREPSQIAARAAMAAVRQATAAMVDMNNERKRKGLDEVRYGMGLHVGNVMFGNVGLKDRLTFSTFGSAVNEVSRLQGLTRLYPDHPIIASEAFTNYCGGDWVTLGAKKLRGVQDKVTILAPGGENLKMSSIEATGRNKPDAGSEAEQVMLLFRNSRDRKPPKLEGNLLQ